MNFLAVTLVFAAVALSCAAPSDSDAILPNPGPESAPVPEGEVAPPPAPEGEVAPPPAPEDEVAPPPPKSDEKPDESEAEPPVEPEAPVTTTEKPMPIFVKCGLCKLFCRLQGGCGGCDDDGECQCDKTKKPPCKVVATPA
ncbi:hypothetical protein HDE_04605 [Halotydeus destructor]|nr:hypothetical protein HDE_04605 [Halotydeus destructor]